VRLTILGGGGFRVPLVYRALAGRPSPVIDEVVLHDVSPSRLKVISRVLAGSPGPSLRSTTSLDEALRGTDFVFCAIRVGGAEGRVRDERRALRLGVVGQETVGAGGIAYGLRTVPVVLDIAHAIADLAPDAWVVNFTNPAGMITEAMRTVLGERVIGICDSPVGLVRRACRAAGAHLGAPAGPRVEAPHGAHLEAPVGARAAVPDYVGINHLGWLRALHVAGVDVLPSLLAAPQALESFEEGRLFGADFLRALGSIPNEYAHFYYSPADVLASLADGPTRGEVVRDSQAAFYAGAASWADTRRRREESYLAEARTTPRDVADLSGGGYEQVALDVMSALSGGPATTLIVNVANGRTLPQLPADLVIETPCAVTSSGAVPSPLAPLETHQLGLVASVRGAERAAITAVVTGSRDTALQAFAIHPLVWSTRIAAALLDSVLSDEPQLVPLLR
jgi:6-phospho-beta-glucosidase